MLEVADRNPARRSNTERFGKQNVVSGFTDSHSETALEPASSAIVNDDRAQSIFSWRGASMLSNETMVYVVSNDPERAKELSRYFLSQRIGAVSLGLAAGFLAAEYMGTARDERISCLIFDLDFPDLSGLDTQTRLAGSDAPPIIFVTEYGDTISGVRAMKNGAIDFMVEPLDYNQLMAAVELALAIDRRNRDERFERIALLSCWKSLTPREAEVFRYTTAGFLNKQAADELGIAENTYQVHRGRVMRKMKASSLANLVRMSTKLEPIFPEMRNGDSARQLQCSIPGNRSNVGFSDAALSHSFLHS
jgi:FixJ family two-component response regulator